MLSSTPTSTIASVPSQTVNPTKQKISEGWGILDVITINDLSKLTGYTDYEYLEPEYNNVRNGEPAGIFWSRYTATVQIEFRAHLRGGLEKLENYRTAAMPGSVVWLESPLWETGCFYYLDEWTAEIVIARGNGCYFVSFVPSAYPSFNDVKLGSELMEMFITKLGF